MPLYARATKELQTEIEQAGVNPRTAHNVLVCIDELSTNIIRQSVLEDRPVDIEIQVSEDRGEVVLLYSDNGTPFNLFKEVPKPNIFLPLEDRQAGGLGVYLIQKLSSSHCYSYRDEKNVVELRFEHV